MKKSLIASVFAISLLASSAAFSQGPSGMCCQNGYYYYNQPAAPVCQNGSCALNCCNSRAAERSATVCDYCNYGGAYYNSNGGCVARVVSAPFRAIRSLFCR